MMKSLTSLKEQENLTKTSHHLHTILIYTIKTKLGRKMKKTILTIIFLTISASANSNEIDINFGCLDCKKNKKESKYKEPTKKSTFENIQIDGNSTIRFEKTN